MKIVEDPQFESGEDGEDAALDRLLATARWPEPTPMDRQRVIWKWNAISRHARGPRSVIGVGVAAAAVVLMTGAALYFAWPRNGSNQVAETIRPTDVKYLNIAPQLAPDKEPRIVSRPANLVERLVLLEQRDRTSPGLKNALPSSIAKNVNNQNEVLVPANRMKNAEESGLALNGMKDEPVDQLLNQLTSPNVDERFAAAKALSTLDDPRVIESLRDLARNEKSRREALAALRWSANPLAKRTLAEIELPAAAQRQLDADEHLFPKYN